MELEMFCNFLGLGLPLYAPCILIKVIIACNVFLLTHFDSFLPVYIAISV